MCIFPVFGKILLGIEVKVMNDCVHISVKDECPLPKDSGLPTCMCVCVCFWRLTRYLRHFLILRPTRRPPHRPPSQKCYYSVMSPSLVRMLLHFHLLSQVECEWCSFSNIRSLELPAAALHKYTTPVSAYNSLQAWKNSDFLYWPDSFAIPNSCMFSPPRILIFKFPFVSALFQWIANKNDSHFYNPWECREQAFQKKTYFLAHTHIHTKRLPTTYQKARFSLHRNIWKCETSRAIIATLRWERRLPAISNAVQSRTLNFPFEQEERLQMEHLLTHAPHMHKESYIYKELNLRAWNSLVTIWQRYT